MALKTENRERLDAEQVAARQWFDKGAELGERLPQFEKFANRTFDVASQLAGWEDEREAPPIATFDVVNALYHAAVLRMPSINALEGGLKRSGFQRLLGFQPRPGQKVFSADVIVNVLDGLNLGLVRETLRDVFWRAERNGAFREGWLGGLRFAAIDGWEPYASYNRHCDACLTREVEYGKEREDGTRKTKTQYYHRFVVAFLVGTKTEVVLDLEPLRTAQQRIDAGERDVTCAEGEESAARRMLERIRAEYGKFIDAFLLDGLYADGPTFTKIVNDLDYAALVVLKNPNHQPLKEAEKQWERQGKPNHTIEEPEYHERVALWEADNISTMANYDGPVRVIKAVVTKTKAPSRPQLIKSRKQRREENREREKQQSGGVVASEDKLQPASGLASVKDTTEDTGEKKTVWTVAVIGDKTEKLTVRAVHRGIRGRWKIENTLFHQWVTRWNLGHVYRHTDNALLAILLIWTLVFNLMQLFLFGHLGRPRKPKDPVDTIINMIEEMKNQVARLSDSIPWLAMLDCL